MPAHHAHDSESAPFVEDTLVPAGTVVTATGTIGNSRSGWGDVDTLRVQAVVSAVGGTTPSLTLQLQGSQDGQNWVNITSGAFTAITANGTAEISLTGPFDDQLRVYGTVTGTTPTFTVAVNAASTVQVRGA